MDAYTMKRSGHANQCRGGISHHPEYGVTAFSWGREKGREDYRGGRRVVLPTGAQPHGDAIADLMKAHAVSHLISARVHRIGQ